MRVGYRRIMRVVEAAGVPVTLNACARAREGVPWLARDAMARGHESCCHGWRWEQHAGMEEAHERETIARAVESVRRVAGIAPVGWHTKSSASVNTRRLLVEHGGFLYDSDAYNDDVPYYVEVAGKPHLVVPYCFDNNDMRFHGDREFVHASDFAHYVIDAFDWMYHEAAEAPKMMSIGLHFASSAAPDASPGWHRRCVTCGSSEVSGSRGAMRLHATGSSTVLRDGVPSGRCLKGLVEPEIPGLTQVPIPKPLATC